MPLCLGSKIQKIHDLLGKDLAVRIPIIFRDDQRIIAEGLTTIEAGDEICFVGKKENMDLIAQQFSNPDKVYKKNCYCILWEYC